MKVHVLQHVPFEGLGSMTSWLQARGGGISYTRFYQHDSLPSPQGPDLIIVMGGPMSVNDEEEFPWLKAEKQFIGDALAGGVPLLGVCLGAELIARTMGSRIYPN